MSKKRVAVLISGRGSNMTALIEAAKDRRLPRRDRARSRQPSGCRRPRAGEAEGIAAAVVDHTAFGKDREAFERAMQAVLETASHRSRLPRRIHAAADALVRAPVGRPPDQHSSCPAARIQGPQHPRARARRRRDASRRHRALRRPGNGLRPDHSFRTPCRCSTIDDCRHARRPRAASSSTASIRWRSTLVARGEVKIGGGTSSRSTIAKMTAN